MADINLSKAVRSNLSSLQNTASLMAKTSDRLSTGNKVNSALDNPTNFFTASSLNSRAGDLNQLMDSMANGIKTIEAADNGLKSITKTLESMQSTLRQARQDKTFATQSYKLGANATGSISFGGGADIATNSISLVNSGTAVQAEVGGAINAAGYAAIAPTAGSTGSAAAITGGAVTTADFDGTARSFSLTVGSTTQTISVNTNLGSGGNLLTDLNAAINTAFGSQVATVTGDVTNGLTITGAANGAAVTVADGTGATARFGFTTGTTDAGQADVPAQNLSFAIGSTTVTLTSANAANLTDAISQMNTQLAGTGVTAGLNADNELVLRGAADGSNNVTVTTSAGATSLFGSTLSANGQTGTAATSKSVDDLVKEINDKFLPNGTTPNPLAGKVRASNDKGELRIENLSTQALSINGINSSGTIDGVDVTNAANRKSVDGNTVRADLAKQYNELRDQLDKLSDDASFNGINLLRGDNLKITFNENGTSAIDIVAKGGNSVNSDNLGVSTSLDAADLDSDTDIDGFLDNIKGALGKVRSQASAFGSNLSIVQNRQDFTKSMINTLETGAGNLTLADMNQEAANMMALQTRQSLASSTLSMANQADQSVLQLLR